MNRSSIGRSRIGAVGAAAGVVGLLLLSAVGGGGARAGAAAIVTAGQLPAAAVQAGDLNGDFSVSGGTASTSGEVVPGTQPQLLSPSSHYLGQYDETLIGQTVSVSAVTQLKLTLAAFADAASAGSYLVAASAAIPNAGPAPSTPGVASGVLGGLPEFVAAGGQSATGVEVLAVAGNVVIFIQAAPSVAQDPATTSALRLLMVQGLKLSQLMNTSSAASPAAASPGAFTTATPTLSAGSTVPVAGSAVTATPAVAPLVAPSPSPTPNYGQTDEDPPVPSL